MESVSRFIFQRLRAEISKKPITSGDCFHNSLEGHGIVSSSQWIGIAKINFVLSRTFFVVRTFRLYSHLFKCQTYFSADIFASVFRGNIHISCVIIRLFGRVPIIIQSKQVKFLFSTKEELESCILGILNCFF